MTQTDSPYGARAGAMRDAFDRSFAAPPAERSQAVENFLAIRLGRRRHALPLSDIAGLFTGKPVTRLPSTQPAFLGLASFRGTIAPVYDLQLLLGHKASERPAWLAVAKTMPVAFAFEGFEGHVRVAPEDIVADESGEQGGSPQTSIRMNGALLPVVHLPAIIGTIGRLMATA